MTPRGRTQETDSSRKKMRTRKRRKKEKTMAQKRKENTRKNDRRERRQIKRQGQTRGEGTKKRKEKVDTEYNGKKPPPAQPEGRIKTWKLR